LNDVLALVVRFTALKPHRLPADDAAEQRQQGIMIIIHSQALPPEGGKGDHQGRRQTGQPDNERHVALLLRCHHVSITSIPQGARAAPA
jgi:hypothetical protein